MSMPDVFVHGIAGAIASGVSYTTFTPFHLVKSNLQAKPIQYRGINVSIPCIYTNISFLVILIIFNISV